MRLGIGNNLISGGGGLNPDKLALDLQFATDKTLTARKGPTPVFTRGSMATFVDSDGLIKYGAENLSPSLTSYSKVQIQTPDSISDGITADSLRYTPTGTPTGYMFTSFTFVQATLVTMSCFVRSSNLTAINFRDFASPAKNSRNFNPTTGLWAASGGDTQFTSYSVSSFGNGWYRISCNYVPTDATASRFFGMMLGQNAATSVDLGGMQIERFSTARTYIPTTTAAVYGPRFDHDPVTGACKGLLIEESRTNICLHSDNFRPSTSGNYWSTISASTVTVDQIASPSGSIDADLLSSSTTAFDCFTRRGFSWAASTQYSYSIFIKRGPSNHRYVGFFHGVLNGSVQATYFDFDNPTVINVPAGQVGVINLTSVTAYPNGWYRINIAFITHTTPIGPYFGVFLSTSTGTQVSGVGGLDVYIWGIQVELGAFPTSYIPTTTASAIRSADVCSISESDFSGFYNPLEGSLFSQSVISDIVGLNRGIVNIRGGATLFMRHVFSNSYFRIQVRASDTETNIQTITGLAFTAFKIALAYSGNNFASSINNSSPSLVTRTLPTGLNELRIGALDTASQLNGTISSLRYYKKRLPDAKLQALTV